MKYLTLLLAIAFSLVTNAQDTKEAFYFNLQKGELKNYFTSYFTTHKKGDKVEIYYSYNANSENYKTPVATGNIDFIGSFVYLHLDFKNEADKANIEQLLVKTQASISASIYKGLIFSLVQNAILITDVYGKKYFYKPQTISKIKSKADEDIIFQEMLDDIVFTAGEMKKEQTFPKITEGKLAGQDGFVAMQNSTLEDIRHFITYMQAHPKKYRGATWSNAEIYATWISSGAPTTTASLAEQLLLNFNNKAKFNTTINQVTKKGSTDIVAQLTSIAKGHIDKKEYQTAENCSKIILTLAEKYKIDNLKGSQQLLLGDIYQAQNEHNKALDNYKEAIKILKKTDNTSSLFLCYLNIGTSLNKTKKKKNYKAAIQYSRKATEILEPVSDSQQLKNILALVYRNYGDAYTNLKNTTMPLKYTNKD